MKHIKLFEQFVESLNKGSYSTLKRNDIIKHTDSDTMLRISVVKPNVSGVILNSGAYKGKPIRMGDVIAVKPKEIEEWELSSLDEASSKLESNNGIMDESYAGLMPLYKKYIDAVKAGEDYEDEYYYFNRALNRGYNTEADKESVLNRLEDRFGKNPKVAGFSKKK